MPSENEMRVWWIPQIPGPPFHVPVSNVEEALLIVDTLGRYDLFQFENKIKPDYANTGGLEVYRDGEWEEWENDEGDCIDDVRRNRNAL